MPPTVDIHGPYQLHRLLGRGAMGEVWLATHLPSGRDVALKRLTSGPADERYRAALQRELRAIAALDHPAVIVVHDAGETDGVPWVVTELADTDLGRARPRTWREVRDVLLVVLSGLAHAHARGILHRDLKPENLLRVGSAWKLADFGIAWDVGAPGADAGMRRAGSPAYMAPEQLRGDVDRLGPWSDLYALGCLGWELVAGEVPYARTTTDAIVQAHLYEPLPRPGAWAAPREYVPWLLQLLAKDPNARFRRAADAARALAAMPDADGEVAIAERRSASTWSTGMDLGDLPTDEVSQEVSLPPSVAPSIPADWRAPADDVEVIPRHGAEMALVGLRTPRVVGRLPERDRLWAALREVEATGGPRLVVVRGEVGAGRTRLLRWLGEQVLELGVADVWWRLGHRRSALPQSLDDMAGDRPRVAILDDLDGDPEAVAFVDRVLKSRAVTPMPILLLASARPSQAVDALLAEAAAAGEELRLGPLAPAETEALVQQVLRVDGAALGELVARSGGNPRFAVEAIADWVRRGLVIAGPHRYRVAASGPLPLPSSLVDLGAAHVEGALAGAPYSVRHALEIATVLEAPASVADWERLCAAAGVEPAVVPDLVDVRGGLVLLAGPMVRAHLEATARETGRWTRWNRLAADLADARPRLRGRHLVEAGDDRGALPFLLAAVEAPDTARDPLPALRLREAALRRLGVPEDDHEWGRQWAALAMAEMVRGDLAASRAAGERALALARERGWDDVISIACRALSVVQRMQGRSAMSMAVEGLAAERRSGGDDPSRMTLFHALRDANRLDEALRMMEEWLEEPRPPRLAGRGILHRMRSRVLLDRGDLRGAQEDARRAVEMDVALRQPAAIAFSHDHAMNVALEAGDLDAATAHAEAAFAHHRRMGTLVGYHSHTLAQAALRMARGDLDGAAAAASSALELGRSLRLREAGSVAVVAEVALARGDRASAVALAAPVLAELPGDAPVGVRTPLLAILAAADAADADAFVELERVVAGGYSLPSLARVLDRAPTDEARALAARIEARLRR